MDRRRALTTAAAVSMTLVAGGTGVALTSSLVGGVGAIDADGPLPGPVAPVTVYVDEPVPATTTPAASTAPAAPAVRRTEQPAVTSSGASSVAPGSTGDEREDDLEEHDEHEHDDAHEHDEDDDD